MRMTPDTDQTVRCSLSGCSCVRFKPGSVLRSCDHCGHSWVAHAVEKLHLQAQRPSGCGPVEVALPGLVFDLSSLVLYGAQAVPVQLKILLDRLYSVLPPEQVSHILHTLGWSLGDYVRGYMLQAPSGEALDRWATVRPEEQSLILQQFLRFGETRSIVQLMTSPGPSAANPLSHTEPSPAPKSCQSNIGTFAKQNGGSGRGSGAATSICCFRETSPADYNGAGRHVGQSPLRPVHVPSSAFHSLAPPTQEPVPPSKPNQEPKLAERRRQEETDPHLHSKPAFKIKADPDTPNLTCRQDRDQEVVLQRGGATQGHAFSLLNSTRLPPSSPPEVPLPPFSSCFICPLPSSPFPSSLHPLPPSPFSLPFLSPAGARKGRVCCGVCGKSFYDKGTLKIHHNAVHLKIKHRCTVAGCAMVFSSLRSRNRHSANPNPRLHTGGSRDAHTHVHTHTSLQLDTRDRNTRGNTHDSHTRVCRERDASTAARKQEANTHAIMNVFNGHAASQQDRRDAPPPQSHSPPSSPLSVPSTQSQSFSLRDSKSDCHAQAPPPQSHSPPPCTLSLSSTLSQSFSLRDSKSDCHTLGPPPPPLIPACASSLGSAPPLAPPAAPTEEETKPSQRFGLHVKRASPACIVSHDYGPTGRPEEAGASPPTYQQRPWESGKPVPKKKPRKSSMPVKIEREKEGGSGEEEESCGVFRGLISP